MTTRLNRFLALATGLSRRTADLAIGEGRVTINGQPAELGMSVGTGDTVTLDGRPVTARENFTLLMLHKPVGYVCSRVQQGKAPTIYDLLPSKYHQLKPVGRLDKDSSGLLLLTDDGALAQRLTHPSFEKQKEYQVVLDKPLAAADVARLTAGVTLADGPSRFHLTGSHAHWTVTIHEGRNRQIRRTFAAVGYTVVGLHRTKFGPYPLGDLKRGASIALEPQGQA
jgi:23S rRNA pseudouridine2605 synthase